MSTKLDSYRKKIDSIDRDIINRIAERMDIVKKVGAYKKANNIPPLDSKRWNEVLKKVILMGKEKNLREELLTAIFNSIHEEALQIEKNT